MINRNKLLWAIVKKHGGEIRIDPLELAMIGNDWELLEYEDMETQELVLKARVRKPLDIVTVGH